jgi:hypothetical protein
MDVTDDFVIFRGIIKITKAGKEVKYIVKSVSAERYPACRGGESAVSPFPIFLPGE